MKKQAGSSAQAILEFCDSSTGRMTELTALQTVKELLCLMPDLDEYVKQYLASEATAIDFERRIIPMPYNPETCKRVHEIADELHVSRSEVIKVINEHGLTSGEYGGSDLEGGCYLNDKGMKVLASILIENNKGRINTNNARPESHKHVWQLDVDNPPIEYQLRQGTNGMWCLAARTEGLKQLAVVDAFETPEEALDAYRGLGVVIKVFLHPTPQ